MLLAQLCRCPSEQSRSGHPSTSCGSQRSAWGGSLQLIMGTMTTDTNQIVAPISGDTPLRASPPQMHSHFPSMYVVPLA